jgi:hypothetical protein
MLLFWMFFVLVFSEAVLVLDRSSNCIIPSWSTRCSGRNLVMDRLMEIRSMIRELGNGGLWAVTKVALMPCTQAFDYEHEHRPPRRTEHEHDRILWSPRPEWPC